MTRPCAVCGNQYDKAFEAHGSEAYGAFYCSAHCAAMEKVMGVVDRV